VGTFTRILQELVRLFVDDGTLAASILVRIAFYGLLLQFLPRRSWQRPILLFGLTGILLEDAIRGAESRSG
jgi:hypothetical protein